jgi:ABC-type lipoprotein export system ATPase subunit
VPLPPSFHHLQDLLDLAGVVSVLESFDKIVREGTTLLVATLDPRVASRMRRIIHMHDGAIATEPMDHRIDAAATPF